VEEVSSCKPLKLTDCNPQDANSEEQKQRREGSIQCLSIREHISGPTCSIFVKFLCLLPMAVARSSSGGVAIRYVLPVMCMASYLHIIVLGHGGMSIVDTAAASGVIALSCAG